MRTAALALLICLASTLAAEPLTTPAIQVVAKGQSGLGLTLSGVPVIRETAVMLHGDGWKKSFYSSHGAWPKRTISYDGKSVTVYHRPLHGKGEIIETATIVAEDKLTFTLAGTVAFDGEDDVRAEWTLGYLNAFPLYGSTIEGDKHKPIALLPHPRTRDGSATLISRSKQITLDGRFGLLRVTTPDGAPEDLRLNFMDGQIGERAWAAAEPSFWLGVSDLKLPAGKPFSHTVTLQFAAKSITPGPAKIAIEPAVRDLQIAYEPEPADPLVIPQPKKFDKGLGVFPANERTRIVFGDEAAVPAAAALRLDAADRFGWTWGVVSPEVAGRSLNVITLLPASGPMAPEAYTLDVTVNLVVIRASTAEGFANGASTLRQLMRAGPSGVGIPVCRVVDEPALGFRGLHLCAGRGEADNFRLLCQRLIAPLKYNHVVLQCDRTEWDATPKLRGRRYTPKGELADWVGIARGNGLEPIPLVNTLGHMDWLFADGAYNDLAEDPDHPWAYIADNAATYALVDKIYDEAYALFGNPHYVHIGHDEVTERGRYPYRDASKQTGATRLFIDDVRHWVDFFKPKPARVMLWADMMLAKGEAPDAANATDAADAAARRQGVPKDAIICDWHYKPVPAADYKSLSTFKDAGFTTVACANHDAANVYELSQAAKASGAWGFMQTTWEMSGPSDLVLARMSRDLSAWVLAAEYAWSGRATPPDQLPYRPADVAGKLFGRSREPTGPTPGFSLDLSKSANVKLTGDGAFLGLADLSAALKATRFAGTSFELPKESGGAVMLAGTLAAGVRPMPREVTLQVNRRALWLEFLQTTAYPAPPAAPVARYEIRYDDGTKAAVTLRYGFEVRAYDDPGPTLATRTGWSGKTAAGADASLRVFRWLNPNPDKTIASVTLIAEHPYASPTILGITGLTK